MILGVILGAGVSYICSIVFFALDYNRTEYVQYEDDEYYYYVKAVPKITVASEDVTVKHINAKKTKRTSDIKDVRRTTEKKSNSTQAATLEEEDILFDLDEK